jgi:predicted aconitase
MQLTKSDRARLEGRSGAAHRIAMRIIVAMARVAEAPRLIDVVGAHVDGGLYHGIAGLEFAERLVDSGARVSVPTTLNVGSLDLLHPHLYRGDDDTAAKGRRLMEAYVEMGCRPTWTCAPYHLTQRPRFGEHIAWAESNAIVFANSVLGARTNRYGDFMDICAAITGRVPYCGLHTHESRRGRLVFRLAGVSVALASEDVTYAALGHLIGGLSDGMVPVIEGLPEATSDDQLKALGAAAAAAGSVGLFHAVGVTPEAPTLDAALGGRRPARVIEISPGDLRRALDSLSTVEGGRIDAVSVGTPHFSERELAHLTSLLVGQHVHPRVEFYVSMGRAVLEEAQRRGWAAALDAAGVRIVTDTCTYVTPIIRERSVVMTNSAKWAYYAPGNLGLEVVFGSLEECVASALSGEVRRDQRLWSQL